MRLEKEQVRYTSVAEYPLDSKIFNIIDKAKTYADLLKLDKIANKKVECKKEVSEIIKFFIKQGVHLESKDAKKVDLTKYYN